MSIQGSKHLLNAVQANGEDFEWYPTTTEIIQKLYFNILATSNMYSHHHYPQIDLLDIGAGDGKIFKTFEKISKGIENENEKLTINKGYAIEKSKTLINAIPENVFVVGTDFWQQSLIDKKVDVLFCNPPYSEYAEFSEKIIKEANAQYIYLVIPERWNKSSKIASAIERREASVEVVGSFSFEDAEDRKARAKVELVRICLKRFTGRYGNNEELKVDPFKLWFEEAYQFEEETESKAKKEKERKEEIKGLIKGDSLIQRLEELYNMDLMHLHTNYQAVATLDAEILKEMSVSKEGLMEALKQKISGTKNLYWQELFDNLDTITSRLTKKSRERMLETLSENTSVDFTSQNIYAVVIWAIKNANHYFDQQLLELYKALVKIDNIKVYKSNQRTLIDDWRYLQDFTHYSLDYRIVLTFWGLLGSEFSYDNQNGLLNNAADLIGDMLTIANNLGFNIESTLHDSSMKWESQYKNNFFFSTNHDKTSLPVGTKTMLGKIQEVVYIEEGGFYQYFIDGMWMHGSMVRTPKDIFAEIKAFKNGNLHVKFNTKFMKALNIEAARLNKWIKSASQACSEFDITEEEAHEFFGSNFALTARSMTNLLPQSKGV